MLPLPQEGGAGEGVFSGPPSRSLFLLPRKTTLLIKVLVCWCWKGKSPRRVPMVRLTLNFITWRPQVSFSEGTSIWLSSGPFKLVHQMEKWAPRSWGSGSDPGWPWLCFHPSQVAGGGPESPESHGGGGTPPGAPEGDAGHGGRFQWCPGPAPGQAGCSGSWVRKVLGSGGEGLAGYHLGKWPTHPGVPRLSWL